MVEHLEPELIEFGSDEFIMGDVWGDGDIDELPTAPLKLEPFQLGRFAVTAREYAAFLNDVNGWEDASGRLLVSLNEVSCPVTLRSGRFDCRPGCDDHPMTCVSWWGANAYADWLSMWTGIRFSLPTEAQWQFASLGMQGLKWSLGNEFDSHAYICAADEPAPVATGVPTILGFYNLTGNVFEWCLDEYRFSFSDDCSPRNRISNHRVIKGGAFILSDAANLRNSKRFSCFENSCLSSIGFRLAASVVVS